MPILETLRKNLTPEQFSAVQDALGDDFDDDMVPRSRLNRVIKQRNEARTELATLKGQVQRGGDDDGDGEPGTGAGTGTGGGFTQADIDTAVNAAKSTHATEIANLHKRYAARAKLQEMNFVDPDLVLSAGLVDLSKVTLDDNGVVTGGLDDQLSSLAQSKPYMVNNAGGSQRGTGKQGGSDEFNSITSREEFLKLPTDKQLEFKNSNPEAFKGFMKSN